MLAVIACIGLDTSLASLGCLPPPASLASVALTPGLPGVAGGVTTASWSQARPLPTIGAVSPQVPISHYPQVALPPTSPATVLGIAPVGPPAFSLSPASEPFPSKLVEKVRSAQFVEMRELLSDNIALLQQMDAFTPCCAMPALPGVLRPRLREVTSLPSWLYCFLAYVAMRTPDAETRNMLAYGRLLIREAQRHGGIGWLSYDRVFRQQAAIDHTLQWNTIHPGIQAATLVGQAPAPLRFCTLCREADHSAPGCALAYLQPTSSAPAGAGAVRQTPPQGPHLGGRRRAPSSGYTICSSWNKGACTYPGSCAFRHVCSVCYKRHKACDCKEAGNDAPRGHQVPTSRPKP